MLAQESANTHLGRTVFESAVRWQCERHREKCTGGMHGLPPLLVHSLDASMNTRFEPTDDVYRELERVEEMQRNSVAADMLHTTGSTVGTAA